MKNNEIPVKGTRTEYNVKVTIRPVEAIESILKNALNLSYYDRTGTHYYIKDDKLVFSDTDYYGDLEKPKFVTENKNKIELFQCLERAKMLLREMEE